MFGHNPQMSPAAEADEVARLKQQIEEILARKPTTELEKVLMSENLALKAEVEQLKKQIINGEREDVRMRVTLARQEAAECASRTFNPYW